MQSVSSFSWALLGAIGVYWGTLSAQAAVPPGTRASTPQFAREFTKPQKRVVKDAIDRIATQKFVFTTDTRGQRARANFATAFAGLDGAAVLRFVTQRLRFMLAPNTKLHGFTARDDAPLAETGGHAEVMAGHWGLEFYKMTAGNPAFRFNWYGMRYLVSGPAIGIVQFKKAFFSPQRSDAWSRAPEILRAAILVHEARHSDCEEPLTDAQLWDLSTQNHTPQGLRCSHAHVRCPKNSPAAGLLACDTDSIGAYGYQALYLDAVARYCVSCSMLDRRIAAQAVTDPAGRILKR